MITDTNVIQSILIELQSVDRLFLSNKTYIYIYIKYMYIYIYILSSLQRVMCCIVNDDLAIEADDNICKVTSFKRSLLFAVHTELLDKMFN